jgi:hypothetical protein
MEKGKQDEHAWVDERVDALAPRDFDPNVAAAWARLGNRDDRPRAGRLLFRVGVGVAACIVVLMLPWPRAAAQRLWDRLTVGRVEVVSVERTDVPESVMAFFQMEERGEADPEMVTGVADAARVAGFAPLLPAPGVLSGAPSLSVVREMKLSTAPIDVAQLRALLARLNASELAVPAEWEGASLTVEGGPVVVADYPDAGIQVMQAGPVNMTMPPGFELSRFMEIAFRVFGRNAADARRLGSSVAANPPLLMVLTPGHHSNVREMAFPQGTGILVGDADEGEGMCLFLNVPGRMFFISARELTEARALALAQSLQ